MTEEGEFKKRLNMAVHHDRVTVFIEDAEKIVDEARMEFPKLWTDGTESKVLERETFVAIMKWKEKWFGAAEKQP